MSTSRYKAGLAAVMLAMTGCAMPSLSPTGTATTVEKGAASLGLQIDWGRKIQAVGADVDQLRVFVTPANGGPIEREFDRSQVAAVNGSTVTLDIANLPGGPARVHLEAYGQGNKIGSGDAVVGLLVGRRTAAHIIIQLTGEGNSDIGPLLPMGELPNEAGVPSPMPSNSPSPIPSNSPSPIPSNSPSPLPSDSLSTSPISYFFPPTATARWTYHVESHTPTATTVGTQSLWVSGYYGIQAVIDKESISLDQLNHVTTESDYDIVTCLDSDRVQIGQAIYTQQIFTPEGAIVFLDPGQLFTWRAKMLDPETLLVLGQERQVVHIQEGDYFTHRDRWLLPNVGIVKEHIETTTSSGTSTWDSQLIDFKP